MRLSPIRLVLGALLGLALAGQRGAADEPKPGHVTVPIETYEKLRRAEERPSITVVDTLRVGGSFQGAGLLVSLLGRSAGQMPAVKVLEPATGARLFQCDGEGIVSQDDDGGYSLTPLQPRFQVRCRLALRGSDRLELKVTTGVLYLESQVSDGELVQSDTEGQARTFSIVRLTSSGGAAVTIRPTATARYRLSLHPDETRFRYQIDVRNPNRSSQSFTLALQNGELVQQVDAQASYEVQGSRYLFNLPPGERTLVLSGTLSGARFAPPVEASVQYLLLESHPLLRPQVSGAARRISPAETRITAEFRGAQAFLLGEKEALGWQVTRLAALRTTSFAVREAAHRFFLTADGKALGESEITIDNQGAPDLTLPMRAEPTFASLKDEPTFLTRSEDGHLWLPLSQGVQKVLVQHRQAMSGRFGLWLGRLYLPQQSAPATRATVELRYPREWMPLYAELAPEYQLPSLQGGDLLFALLLLLWTERALALLGLRGRGRLLCAGVLALCGAALGWAAALLIVGDGAVTVLWAVPLLRRLWQRSGLWTFLLGSAGAMLLLIAALATFSRSGVMAPAASDYRVGSKMARMAEIDRPATETTAAGPADAAARGQAYQGLPAKFEMPAGDRQSYFYREMLNTETPRQAVVLLLSRRAAAGVTSGLLALAALLLLLYLRPLRGGLQALAARAAQG